MLKKDQKSNLTKKSVTKECAKNAQTVSKEEKLAEGKIPDYELDENLIEVATHVGFVIAHHKFSREFRAKYWIGTILGILFGASMTLAIMDIVS